MFLSSNPSQIGQAIAHSMMRNQRLPVSIVQGDDALYASTLTTGASSPAAPLGYFTDAQGQLQVAPVFIMYITPPAPEIQALNRLLKQARWLWPSIGACIGLVCGTLVFQALSAIKDYELTKASQHMPCLVTAIHAEHVLCSVNGQAVAIKPNELFPDGLSRLVSANAQLNQFVYLQTGQYITTQLLSTVVSNR